MTFTITGDVATLLGVDHSPGDPVALWVECSQPIMTVDSEGRLGGRLRVDVASDGTFEVADLPGSVDDIPLYRLVIDSRSLRQAGTRGGITTGWFPLTADRDLTWIIANYVEVTVITTQVAANVAAAAALGATNNTATASFITSAGATQTALDARVATLVPTASTTTQGRVELATTTETQTGTDTARAITPSAAAKAYKPVITPEAYGAIGDGVADDTAAWISACAAANATLRVGLGGNIYEPGATISARGKYKLTTLAAPLVVSANMDAAQAELVIPNAYAGVAVLAGHPDSGKSLHNADIVLPSVIKSGATTLPAGGVGVKIQNLQHSRLRARRTTHHETGLWFTALGVVGTVYNEIFPGWVDLCKISWSLTAQTDGWVNQNVFIAGGISQSPNTLDSLPVTGRRSGWHHVILEGGTGHVVHGNSFIGCSFEGDYSQSNLLFHNAQENIFTGSTRFETGSIGEPVTASATFDVLTSPGNPLGFTAGQAIVVTADVAPGNVTLNTIYWVNAVTSGQDIAITTTQGGGGTNVNITSNGTNVRVMRPPIVHFNNADGNTFHNIIRDYNSYPGPLDIIRTGAAAPAAKTPIVG